MRGGVIRLVRDIEESWFSFRGLGFSLGYS